MELHSKITFHITNNIFNRLSFENSQYVKSCKFSSYESFKVEFERYFNFGYIMNNFSSYINNESDSDLYNKQFEELLNLLEDFYPILQYASGEDTLYIIDDIIISHFNNQWER